MQNLIYLQEEIWTDIFGFENYEISNTAKVRKKLNQKIFKQLLNNYDYYYVGLRKSDKYHSLLVHRLLPLHYIPNPQQFKYVDHKDNDRKNNCLQNLRWVTMQQNNMNKKKYKNSQSQFKGVSFYQNTGKWLAQIRINGKLIYLGYFINEEEAARVFDRKAIELFGEYAKTNFHRENYSQEEGEEE